MVRTANPERVALMNLKNPNLTLAEIHENEKIIRNDLNKVVTYLIYNNLKRNLTMEKYLIRDVDKYLRYARILPNERFFEYEELFMMNPDTLFGYLWIINRRWVEAEPYIVSYGKKCIDRYIDYLMAYANLGTKFLNDLRKKMLDIA
jgi:hypothetical protein